MASDALVASRAMRAEQGSATVRPARTDGLARWALLSAAVWQVGSHVDAWYHFRDGFEIVSFVTWPHALLYAAWALTFALTLWRAVQHRDWPDRRGPWPAGARPMLLGTALFGVGPVLAAPPASAADGGSERALSHSSSPPAEGAFRTPVGQAPPGLRGHRPPGALREAER